MLNLKKLQMSVLIYISLNGYANARKKQNIGKKKSTKATASSAATKAVAPGKILFGMNGTKVDHITCKKNLQNQNSISLRQILLLNVIVS